MPGKIFFKHIQLRQQDYKNQVDDDGNPGSFTAAGARQIVLQLDEQVRYAGIIVESYSPSCSGCGFSGGATGSWNGICVIGMN